MVIPFVYKYSLLFQRSLFLRLSQSRTVERLHRKTSFLSLKLPAAITNVQRNLNRLSPHFPSVNLFIFLKQIENKLMSWTWCRMKKNEIQFRLVIDLRWRKTSIEWFFITLLWVCFVVCYAMQKSPPSALFKLIILLIWHSITIEESSPNMHSLESKIDAILICIMAFAVCWKKLFEVFNIKCYERKLK